MPLIPIPIGWCIDLLGALIPSSFWIACGIVSAMLVIMPFASGGTAGRSEFAGIPVIPAEPVEEKLCVLAVHRLPRITLMN